MTYEEKKAARIERYEARAEKARQESRAYYARAEQISRRFADGQPIIVEHYSEAGARRDQQRIWDSMDKCVAAAEKADYHAEKAKAAANNTAIYDDDPEALEKLRRKLEALEAKQAMMKAVNAYYRKHKTCVGYPEMSDDTARKLDHAVQTGYSWETAPYPSYELTNNNANIRRIRERVQRLEKRLASQPEEPTKADYNGFQVVENAEINRIQILFPGKPDEETRRLLKSYGFRWAPSEGAWQRQLNGNGRFAAKMVVKKLNG